MTSLKCHVQNRSTVSAIRIAVPHVGTGGLRLGASGGLGCCLSIWWLGTQMHLFSWLN
jgi:hypothetical protein